MKTIIVDDEEKGRLVLAQMLKMHFPHFTIQAQCSNATDAKLAIEKYSPDLVLLDIAMPGKSGIQMLQEMEEVDFKVIFVTAHDQFTLQAIKLSALDYLLKPVMDDEFIAAIQKAESQLNKEKNKDKISILKHNLMHTAELKITLPTSSGFIIKQIDDLLYCEADNSYTKFFFNDNTMIMVTKPLSYYDNLLNEYSFIRIHKSYLANEKHIVSFNKSEGASIVLVNGKTLEVSKRKKEMVIDLLKSKHLS